MKHEWVQYCSYCDANVASSPCPKCGHQTRNYIPISAPTANDAPDSALARATRAEEERDKFMWQVRDTCTRAEKAEADRDRAQAEVARLREALKGVRQSLKDQAAARADPTMPLLTKKVVEGLRASSEAAYALAENRSERVEAHGLSLLCDWQDHARAALAQQVKP